MIGFFGTQEDRSFLHDLRVLVSPHGLKVSLTPELYVANLRNKIKQHGLTSIICTCPETLVTLLNALPDFRHPIGKRGTRLALKIDDYAGSFFKIAAPGATEVDVLILDPLKHLHTVPEAPFVFKRFISKITQPAAWKIASSFTWEVWTPAKSDQLLARFSQARLLAIDIETHRDHPQRTIQCVGYAALFPDGSTHTVVVPFKDMLAHQFVRKMNESPPAKIFQNGLYDNLYFFRWNVPVHNWLYDTNNLFHAWYAELPKKLSFISAFCLRYVRYWKDDAAGSEYNKFEYNARDCWGTLLSCCVILMEAPKWAINNYLIEFPLVFPCLHVEADGMTVDLAVFTKQRAASSEQLAVVKQKLASWLGAGFNPLSPVQCKNLLRVLGAKGVDSADNAAMNATAATHPFNELIISEVLAYKKQAKLLSTYLVWDKMWMDRLFYKLNPAGTTTGRLASGESSFWCGLQIQNIPQGKAVKSWIKADTEWLLAEGDAAQSEARCVGYLSGCKALIALVESDKDYHTWNAHKFFGVKYEDVTKSLRNLAKRVNHGANYNMGPEVLLDTMGPKAVAEARLLLKLPAKWTLLQVCQHLLATYAKAYPEVKRDWYDAIKATIKLSKVLVSPLGWTRMFFADPTKSKAALNAAVAHGPQNLSVGIINRLFYRVWHASLYGELQGKVRLKAQIHDSLLFCYKDESTPARVQEMMKEPVQVKGTDNVTRTLLIPIEMNSRATYWADLK